ncbi:MAG: hypothetical protein A2V86_12095 [Deltaproteobacteria bacterium RBG_16_49_23]|nr:MAG: hypothetical protein A2V86_12095 [Deltaproteobacteria bacterium RBG_16_49_23]
MNTYVLASHLFADKRIDIVSLNMGQMEGPQRVIHIPYFKTTLAAIAGFVRMDENLTAVHITHLYIVDAAAWKGRDGSYFSRHPGIAHIEDTDSRPIVARSIAAGLVKGAKIGKIAVNPEIGRRSGKKATSVPQKEKLF